MAICGFILCRPPEEAPLAMDRAARKREELSKGFLRSYKEGDYEAPG